MAKDPNEEANRKPRSRRRRQTSTADWASCNPTSLVTAISNVARQGGALRLGYTQDGGAYAIGIYGDGDPYTEYVRPSEDISEYMGSLARAWED